MSTHISGTRTSPSPPPLFHHPLSEHRWVPPSKRLPGGLRFPQIRPDGLPALVTQPRLLEVSSLLSMRSPSKLTLFSFKAPLNLRLSFLRTLLRAEAGVRGLQCRKGNVKPVSAIPAPAPLSLTADSSLLAHNMAATLLRPSSASLRAPPGSTPPLPPPVGTE